VLAKRNTHKASEGELKLQQPLEALPAGNNLNTGKATGQRHIRKQKAPWTKASRRRTAQARAPSVHIKDQRSWVFGLQNSSNQDAARDGLPFTFRKQASRALQHDVILSGRSQPRCRGPNNCRSYKRNLKSTGKPSTTPTKRHNQDSGAFKQMKGHQQKKTDRELT
jgi:hypothetical protein